MPRYRVRTNVSSHFVYTDDRILGAYGTSFWRSWVYPFYTPSGHTVVENSPFDHPFHNGIWVGQNPVRVGDREGNFWGLPVKRCHDDPVAVRKTAAYGAVDFPQTKFGSICMRVEPRLLPPLGGQVIGCLDGELRRGTADDVANQKACDAVAYENDVPGLGVHGVCLMILDNSAMPDRRGPWFIRDYGLATVNTTQREGLQVPAGGTWHVALRVVAYDGPLTAERLAAWRGV